MTTHHPLIAWPYLDELDPMPLIDEINTHARAHLPPLTCPLLPSIDSDPNELESHKPLLIDHAGKIIYEGPYRYFDPRAAWDTAVAYAYHYEWIVKGAAGDAYVNYFFKSWNADRTDHYISGCVVPGEEPGIVRDTLFVECRFDVGECFQFINCTFVNCTPRRHEPEHYTLVNCTIDGALV